MTPVEQAQLRILAEVHPLASEQIGLAEAAGRYTAKEVSSPVDLPHFHNSAMDGYAVRAQDMTTASAERPVALQVIGRVAAGEVFGGEVVAGTCVRLFTGSVLPAGADAVVMQEDTRPLPGRSGEVLFSDTVKPWENIRLRGEDVKRGRLLLPTGEKLTSARIGLLGAVGINKINVSRRPTVAVIATGSELREAGTALAPGQIYESNRLSLATMIAAAGAVPRIYPLVPDTLAATRDALQRASESCDVVLTSGGVSVGEFDFVKTAVEEIGGELGFWKVAIKPGKPFVFGKCGGKLFFGLPGNPVSALVTFALLVRPALLRLQSARRLTLEAQLGVMAEPLVNRGDRRHFVRVTVDDAGQVRSAGIQASHVLSSLSLADGLVDVPPETTFEKGKMVTVLRWE